jgi:hypothetical protein
VRGSQNHEIPNPNTTLPPPGCPLYYTRASKDNSVIAIMVNQTHLMDSKIARPLSSPAAGTHSLTAPDNPDDSHY